MKDDAGKPLEYEQRATLISHRQYRRLMALTLLNTILLAGFVIGPTVGPMVKGQWQAFQKAREQRRAFARQQQLFESAKRYSAPADRILYEERPDEAAKLLALDPTGFHLIRDTRSVYFPPHPWQPPVARSDTPPLTVSNSITLFLHARTTPSGAEQLVRVRLQGAQSITQVPYDSNPEPKRRDYSITTRRMLITQIVHEDGDARDTRLLDLGRDTPNGHIIWKRAADNWEHGNIEFKASGFYRFYPGQADANDASHFTIDYERDGVRATIDGWLRENDQIELIPREGAAVDRDARGMQVVWDPTITPTTTTTTTRPNR